MGTEARAQWVLVGVSNQVALGPKLADSQQVGIGDLDRHRVGRLEATDRLGYNAVGLADAPPFGDHRQPVEISRGEAADRELAVFAGEGVSIRGESRMGLRSWAMGWCALLRGGG